MKIVLTSVGSRGDVQPMIAIALRLRARGHAVTLLLPPDFEPWARRLGFAFAGVGDDFRGLLRAHARHLSDDPVKMLRALRAVAASQVHLQFERTVAVCGSADVVVTSGGQFAAPSLAELGIPVVGVALQPNLMPSRLHPPAFVPWRLPRIWNGAAWALTRLLMRAVLEPINRERAALELPPATRFDDYVYGFGAILLATDPVVAPRDPSWSAAWRQVGPIFLDDPTPLDPDLDAWLNDGPPPVYVGFGSMSTRDPERVTREVIGAVTRTGRRGLISAGWAGLAKGGCPRGWRVVDEAPHQPLFPRCAAVVHHGGSGTTAAALRAGVPQVVVPHVLDQFYFAHRLEDCGIAPAPVPVARLRADRLARAIDAAIALDGTARSLAAARVARMDGAGEVTRVVEAIGAGREVERPAA